MIDLSDLLNALLDGGRITISVSQPDAPLHHTARCAECGWSTKHIHPSPVQNAV